MKRSKAEWENMVQIMEPCISALGERFLYQAITDRLIVEMEREINALAFALCRRGALQRDWIFTVKVDTNGRILVTPILR